MTLRRFRMKRGATIEGIRYNPTSPELSERYYEPSDTIGERVLQSLVRNGTMEPHYGDIPADEKPTPSRAARQETPPTPKGGKPRTRTAEGETTVKTQSKAGKAAQKAEDKRLEEEAAQTPAGSDAGTVPATDATGQSADELAQDDAAPESFPPTDDQHDPGTIPATDANDGA